MSSHNYAAGFYGKLPSHGDFLSRRLPRQFVEPWDQWLQGGLAASREQLGKNWLNTFLISPIWQFALAPGLCGGDAWAGVMIPSVDRVGRYFPLTLAAKVNDCQLTRLFDSECGWFDALTKLALSSLEYEFDLQAFDEQLEGLYLSDYLHEPQSVSFCKPVLPASSARMAFQFQLDREQATADAFIELGKKLSSRFLAQCSYWRSEANEDPILLLCEGLPPIDAYVGFLNGVWPERGWQFSSSRLDGSIATEATNAPLQSVLGVAAEGSFNQVFSVNQSGKNEGITVNKIEPAANEINTVSRWDSCGLSEVGLRRKLNEDAVLERCDDGMWAVADGMGGHSAGDVASQALVAALSQIPRIDDLEHYCEQVASCLHTVNRDLVQMAENRGNGSIIGSTIVVLLISGRQFRYLWAGDSRLYRFRQGILEQLTSDHSLYNESISQGLQPMDGSLEEGRGNIITRAIGAELQLQLDYGQGDIAAEDIFILCSDGLDKELAHADIAALCSSGSASEISRSLVCEAEARGGRDNISVIVIKI